MALSRWREMHIHRWRGGTVFSHDLFFMANGKEKCASVINVHDYLLRKCGFLAQQLHFYDLNPRQDVSSCTQSYIETSQRVWWAKTALSKCSPSAVPGGVYHHIGLRSFFSSAWAMPDFKPAMCLSVYMWEQNTLIVLQIELSKPNRTGEHSDVKMLLKSPQIHDLNLEWLLHIIEKLLTK